MKLLIIRHGESEADILRVHEGRADFNLTERGHKQAEAMANYVAENFEIKSYITVPGTIGSKTSLIWLNVLITFLALLYVNQSKIFILQKEKGKN